ncbi:protein UL150 [Panine betaherpesvirus 2]|uniref:Protein UL150 n=1 Tax=Panine betaherpesvirus 2 TaxID=188763 RepID=Q8QRW1_9BETA|nr:protein UL150 [Panine betaherpesvirus 2]AAM00777.1 protein UL150 [Panine betaherpesvirus 2]QXV67892.1 protein UL150 [Panine betaherpesvirus 2]
MARRPPELAGMLWWWWALTAFFPTSNEISPLWQETGTCRNTFAAYYYCHALPGSGEGRVAAPAPELRSSPPLSSADSSTTVPRNEHCSAPSGPPRVNIRQSMRWRRLAMASSLSASWPDTQSRAASQSLSKTMYATKEPMTSPRAWPTRSEKETAEPRDAATEAAADWGDGGKTEGARKETGKEEVPRWDRHRLQPCQAQRGTSSRATSQMASLKAVHQRFLGLSRSSCSTTLQPVVVSPPFSLTRGGALTTASLATPAGGETIKTEVMGRRGGEEGEDDVVTNDDPPSAPASPAVPLLEVDVQRRWVKPSSASPATSMTATVPFTAPAVAPAGAADGAGAAATTVAAGEVGRRCSSSDAVVEQQLAPSVLRESAEKVRFNVFRLRTPLLASRSGVGEVMLWVGFLPRELGGLLWPLRDERHEPEEAERAECQRRFARQPADPGDSDCLCRCPPIVTAARRCEYNATHYLHALEIELQPPSSGGAGESEHGGRNETHRGYPEPQKPRQAPSQPENETSRVGDSQKTTHERRQEPHENGSASSGRNGPADLYRAPHFVLLDAETDRGRRPVLALGRQTLSGWPEGDTPQLLGLVTGKDNRCQSLWPTQDGYVRVPASSVSPKKADAGDGQSRERGDSADARGGEGGKRSRAKGKEERGREPRRSCQATRVLREVAHTLETVEAFYDTLRALLRTYWDRTRKWWCDSLASELQQRDQLAGRLRNLEL